MAISRNIVPSMIFFFLASGFRFYTVARLNLWIVVVNHRMSDALIIVDGGDRDEDGDDDFDGRFFALARINHRFIQQTLA